MNFLQLVQRLSSEVGQPGSGPTSVVAQTGDALRLVNWINESWIEIQSKYDAWTFMRKQFSFNTVAGTWEYTPDGAPGVGVNLTDFRYWWKDTLRVYLASVGTSDEQFMVEWDYQTFRNTYRYGQQEQGRPLVFAERPADKALLLGPTPSEIFTIVGEYQAVPTALAANADTPAIKSHLQMVIVYRAMMHYGMYQSAGEVVQRGQAMYSSLMAQMTREYLPTVGFPDPLA